jgi:beta-glucosidase
MADDQRDMLGSWSAAGDWKRSVSVIEGIKKLAGSGVNLVYAKGANLLEDSSILAQLNANGGDIVRDRRTPGAMIDEAVAAASKSDVVVAVLGEPFGMCGEAASLSDINLPANQEDLLKALVATGKPVVLVLMNGRPLTLPWENEHVGAILEAWYGGTESGDALADVLFGDYSPSGKLTISFPRNVGQIPVYYNHKNTGRPYDGKSMEKYKSRYLDVANDPLYPFGYGLSYTHFDYSALSLDKKTMHPGDKLTIRVTVSNTGNRDGEETAQLYIRDLVASVTQPVKELKGFRKVFLKKGESRELVFTLSVDDLKYYNTELKRVYDPGEFRVFVGGDSQQVQEAGFELVGDR